MEEAEMGVLNVTFPIRAGKDDDARAFAAEMVGARRAEFEAHIERADITRETWALQNSRPSCASSWAWRAPSWPLKPTWST
jgi:hypothetical protein